MNRKYYRVFAEKIRKKQNVLVPLDFKLGFLVQSLKLIFILCFKYVKIIMNNCIIINNN